jgi:Tfp pilus assembly protein PilX
MRKSSGQALLVVLLVLSVALTAGLSLVARTTTDISVSQKETESNKAFEAAEAGVEEALKKLAEGTTSVLDIILESGADVNVQISNITATQPAIRSLRSGEAATFWLNNFNLDGEVFPSSEVVWQGGVNSFKVCWNDSSVNNAVEVIVYYQQGTTYGFDRFYKGNSSTTCSQAGFSQGMTITYKPEYKFVNVRFYDTNTSKVVRFLAESQGLPPQGKIIDSQGEVGDVSRRIQVTRTWPELPSFFDFVLFSGGNLNK